MNITTFYRRFLSPIGLILVMCILTILVAAQVRAELASFQITSIDTDCTHYATFQSHNQKVVQNKKGIFLTYMKEFETSGNPHWRLMRSTDGGQSFSTLYTSPKMGSNAPALATDRNNNLFLACYDSLDPKWPLFLYRFDANSNYTNYTSTRINWGGSGKYTMAYDEDHNRIFIFNHNGQLFVLDSDTGQLISSKQVMNTAGLNAETQYPHLHLDRNGILHHAWTTQHLYLDLYWDIHYTQSPDGGVTWQKADGTTLLTPFNPDDSGPTDQIILPDEYNCNTWLSNMLPKNGKVHFAYNPDAFERQHYVRIDLTTGQIDKNISTWSGDTLSIDSFAGFFATRAHDPNSPLVFVGEDNRSYLVALISWDNGDSWSDLAVKNWPTSDGMYAIGGSAEITDYGFVIGSFTDTHGDRGDPYFFKIALPYMPPQVVNFTTSWIPLLLLDD